MSIGFIYTRKILHHFQSFKKGTNGNYNIIYSHVLGLRHYCQLVGALKPAK